MGALWSRQVGSIGGRVMGLLALACIVVLLIAIPNEIISAIFYLAFLALVAMVGALAFVAWLAETA